VTDRPVTPEALEGLAYEAALGYVDHYPTAAAVGVAVHEVDGLIYAMVTAAEVYDENGAPITGEHIAAVHDDSARRYAMELAAIRACGLAHAELDRALADLPSP
jgi:hypothetical protein